MEEQIMKLLFLSHHWTNNSHHSRYSGFQRIVHFAAEKNEVTLITWGPDEQDYTDGRIRVLTVKGRQRDPLFLKRIAISRKGLQLANEFDAIHALYSDCTFFLPLKKFTMTVHVLPGVVNYKEPKQKLFLFLKYHLLQRRALRRAKNIVCVSTNLLSAIPGKYASKARFIPHGIDTDFWDPALAKIPSAFPAGDYILCVGAHGLDRQLMTDFIRSNPSRTFLIVGLKDQLDPFPNTKYLYHISDEELRDLYAGAALMIRPLLFATANNSILEALAMGKTILASRIPGVTDYLTDKTCIFIDTLQQLSLDNAGFSLLDPALIRQTATTTLSWNKILETYSDLYLQTKHPSRNQPSSPPNQSPWLKKR
jgi:glycosyltransferase involved in cell wall biosynthesis